MKPGDKVIVISQDLRPTGGGVEVTEDYYFRTEGEVVAIADRWVKIKESRFTSKWYPIQGTHNKVIPVSKAKEGDKP